MSKKILVVDDEASIVQILTMILEMNGYRVCSANDGITGLEMLEKEKPDLMLLDLMMPRMDGYQVLASLKEKGLEIPVIVVSALAQQENIDKAFSLGASDYAVKGINPGDLMAKIDRLLNEKD